MRWATWSVRFLQSLLEFEAKQILEWQLYMLYEILTSYNAVYHEIGFFDSAFMFVLGTIIEHHETSISSKSHRYSPLKWEASVGRLSWQRRRRSSQKPNQDSCYDDIRDGWGSKPDDRDRLEQKGWQYLDNTNLKPRENFGLTLNLWKSTKWGIRRISIDVAIAPAEMIIVIHIWFVR